MKAMRYAVWVLFAVAAGVMVAAGRFVAAEAQSKTDYPTKTAAW